MASFSQSEQTISMLDDEWKDILPGVNEGRTYQCVPHCMKPCMWNVLGKILSELLWVGISLGQRPNETPVQYVESRGRKSCEISTQIKLN